MHAAAHTQRNAEIVRYLPLVRAIAIRVSRRYPSNLEVQDLVNVGTIGLIEAVERFQADRGVSLKTFAEPRIRGAMVDAIRKTDWVPREVRRRNHLLSDTRHTLQQKLGREPSPSELAAALGLSPQAFDALADSAASRPVVSLDSTVGDDSDTALVELVADESGASPVDAWIDSEDRGALASALASLPDDERTVMTLYYEQGMKYREIGALMAITESRVCQIRGVAVERLRKRVTMPGRRAMVA